MTRHSKHATQRAQSLVARYRDERDDTTTHAPSVRLGDADAAEIAHVTDYDTEAAFAIWGRAGCASAIAECLDLASGEISDAQSAYATLLHAVAARGDTPPTAAPTRQQARATTDALYDAERKLVNVDTGECITPGTSPTAAAWARQGDTVLEAVARRRRGDRTIVEVALRAPPR